VEESTSRRTNNVSQSKVKRGVSPVDDDEDDCESMYAAEEYGEKPVDDRPAPKGESKKRSASTPKPKVKSTPTSSQHPTSFNNGVEESTSRQRSRTNNTARSKTKKRASSVYDDEEYDAEIPAVDPVASEPRSKKTKKRPTLTPKQKAESAPVSPQYANSFSNGSGNMINHNIGNYYYSTIEDAFNDNSVNTFNGRRKPA